MKPRISRGPTAVVLVTATVLASSALWSSETLQALRPVLLQRDAIPRLEPVLAMPRTSMLVAMMEAERHLAAEEYWSAWRLLRPYLDTEEATASTHLLAAQATAGIGDWKGVLRLVERPSWPYDSQTTEALALVARANEALERWPEAVHAYRRLTGRLDGLDRARAEARLAIALLKLERSEDGARAFASAATAAPQVADWLRVRELEAMTLSGRPDPRRLSGVVPAASPAARLRLARAQAAARLALQDSAGAVDGLRGEVRLLHQQRAVHEAAELSIDLARVLLAQAETGEARDLLRSVAWENTVPERIRLRAANLLGDVGGLSASEELARAAAFEAGGRPGLAARSLRSAIAGGAVSAAGVRLRLGRLLFDAGDHRAAREVLLDAADALEDPERKAEAELLAARSRFRTGDRSGGLSELRRLTERRGSTAAAGTAHFLLADAAARVPDALPHYQRAAAVPSAPESREALSRLADRRLRSNDVAGAIRAWEQYVSRYPSGEATAELAYSLALRHEKAGRADRAREQFRAAIAADPLSYAALRAGERLGEDPLSVLFDEPRPWPGLAGDGPAAREALRRLELLHELGLRAEWEEELAATIRRFDERPAALIVLAEGLRDHGHSLEAVRLGRALFTKRGAWDERLLRVVFPLPYRDVLLREANRQGVDPMLLAGLIRQESLFRPAVRSRVGATGLTQIMPATGRWIAPRVGIAAAEFDELLLTVPEVSLRMGALYLGDLLNRYGGARDLALAGYNAGPARADRWRRELGYDRDVDGFRDAIPFEETRHYVRIVLRNAAVYRRLYAHGSGNAEAAGFAAE